MSSWMFFVVVMSLLRLKDTSLNQNRSPLFRIAACNVALRVVANHVEIAYLRSTRGCTSLQSVLCKLKSRQRGFAVLFVLHIEPVMLLKERRNHQRQRFRPVSRMVPDVSVKQIRVGHDDINDLRLSS